MGTRKITPAVRLLLLLVPVGIGVLMLFTRSGLGDYRGNISGSSEPTPMGPEAAQTVRASEPTLSAEDQAKLRVSTLYRSLYELPGVVIAKGGNTTPRGRYGLLTYRVEAVSLPKMSTFTSADKTYTVNEVWRVIIIATEPFPITSMGESMRIGNISLKAGSSLNQLVAIVFNASILKEGAIISVGLVGTPNDTVLSETLHLASSPYNP